MGLNMYDTKKVKVITAEELEKVYWDIRIQDTEASIDVNLGEEAEDEGSTDSI